MDLDILYVRENAIARALPDSMVGSFSQMWDWASQQHLAGAIQCEIARDAVAFLIGARQIENLTDITSMLPGMWFYYSGPARFSWNKGRNSGTASVVHPGSRCKLKATLRSDSMLTATSWVNLKGHVENTFVLGRIEAAEEFDAYAVGHENLYSSFSPSSGGFRMTGHMIREGVPECDFASLTGLIDRIVAVFGDTLCLRRGWALVGVDGAVREKNCQILFDVVAAHAAKNILVDREPETGLGPVDFIVSGFGERHGIELKVYRGNLREIENGLKIQLPTYMKAKQLHRGWLVVILSGTPGPSSDTVELATKLHALNADDGIEIRVLDARSQASASRRTDVVP